MKHGRYSPRPQIAVTLTVTKDMLPSFRIIAYYHTNDNEVVSDSVWVEVKVSCMGTVSNTTATQQVAKKNQNKLPMQVMHAVCGFDLLL